MYTIKLLTKIQINQLSLLLAYTYKINKKKVNDSWKVNLISFII